MGIEIQDGIVAKLAAHRALVYKVQHMILGNCIQGTQENAAELVKKWIKEHHLSKGEVEKEGKRKSGKRQKRGKKQQRI